MTVNGSRATHPLGFVVWLAGMVAIGCSTSEGSLAPDAPRNDTALQLPVRVHVLSSRLANLDARLTDPEVTALMARVNQIWSSAGIAWETESIVREPAVGEAVFELALQGESLPTSDIAASVLPRENRLAGGWDVFIVQDLTSAVGAPGVYFPGIPAVAASVIDPAGLADPGRILAHELGHSLGLPHVPCTPTGNLMAPGCSSQDRTRLTPDQIARARSRAASGLPAR